MGPLTLRMNIMSRNLPLFSLVALCAIASPARAEDKVNCTLKADKDDRVAKGQDLEVVEGQRLKDAVVVEGNLIIRRGASVKSAVALRGSVTVEAGAEVRESVLVIGGTATISPQATVKGRLVLNDRLELVGDDGGRVDLSLSINGESVGRRLVKEVLKSVHACRVEHP